MSSCLAKAADLATVFFAADSGHFDLKPKAYLPKSVLLEGLVNVQSGLQLLTRYRQWDIISGRL